MDSVQFDSENNKVDIHQTMQKTTRRYSPYLMIGIIVALLLIAAGIAFYTLYRNRVIPYEQTRQEVKDKLPFSAQKLHEK